MKASLLMAPYTVRSERLFCEQLDYNFLFRWFLEMDVAEASFDHSTFSRNRARGCGSRSLIAEEAAPFLGLAADLVRRFLPDADQRTVTIAAVWLLGQCSVFQRNREQLAEPPREARPRRARSRMAQHRDQPLIGCRSGSGRRRSNAPLPLMDFVQRG